MADDDVRSVAPLLAIAIPTYNRAEFLPDLLASIEREWDPRIEVVVSDNGSTDDTQAVLERWRSRLPALTIIRQRENIGADRNFLAAVELATGDFCWLMGSDDALAPGAIATLLRTLEEHSDLVGVSVNYASRSFDLSAPMRSIHDPDFAETRLLHGTEEVFHEIGHHLGYLSSQVVRRSLWLEQAANPRSRDFYASYIHVYLIGRMLERGGAWLVLADRLVHWRTGNDSFLTHGRLRRMRIDVEGYGAIGDALLGHGSEGERHFRSRIAAVHVFNALGAMRRAGDWSAATRRDSRALLRRWYGDLPIYRRRLLPLLYVPGVVLRAAANLRQRLRRS